MTRATFRRTLLLAGLALGGLSPRLEARPLYRTLFHAFDFGGLAVGVQLDDLNGDGRLDLIAPFYGQNSVLVRLGDGEGDFGPPAFLSLPGQPVAFTVARLNPDDHPDLLVTNGTGTLSVFYGAGDGTFGERLDLTVGGNPTAVAVGDVNEDGRADVAVTSSTSSKVQVLFGFIDTFFYPVLDLPAGFDPGAVELRDVSGDTHLDLVVMNRGSATISVFLGDGAGNFASPTDLAGLASLRDMTIADLSGDARPDIAATMGTTGEVWVYLATGGGSFAAPAAYPANATPAGLVIAPFDGDAIPDLLIANSTPGAASLLAGNGDGTFAGPITVRAEVSPVDVAAGDLNGDGKMDFTAANAHAISVHLGNGDGTFGSQTNTYDIGPGHKVIAVSDLDRDGRLDLAVTSGAGATLSVLFGRGDGTFETGPVMPTPVTPQGVAAGDLNEDGYEDLVTMNRTANSYTLFMSAGPRTWSAGLTTALATSPFACALEDLNGDQHLDLVVLKREFVNVFLGHGDGTFEPYSSYRAANWDAGDTSDLKLADVDGNGATDLVVSQAGCCPGRVWVLLGNGDGSVQERSLIWESEGGWVSGLAVGQFTADTNPDVLLGISASSTAHAVGFLPGHGDGTFAALAAAGPAYQPVWAEAGDVNGDGYDDGAVANRAFPWMVSLHVGHGDGTLVPRLDFGIGGGATCVKIADFDRDGDADLVVGDTNSNRIWVLASQRAIPTGSAELPAATVSRPWLTAGERADGRVHIAFALPAGDTAVELAVYDVRGRLVRALAPEPGRAGRNMRVWDRNDAHGGRVGRGVYFVRLRLPAASATCKVAVVRP